MLAIAEQLAMLRQLQDVDARLYALRRQRDAQPQAIETLKSQLAAERRQLTQLEEQHKILQTQHKTQELELGTREEQVKKLQAQLFQVKTNKEYTTMQHEIEGAKADNSLLEETIITLLEEIDGTRAKMAAAKTAFQQREAQTAEDIRRIEAEMRAIDDQLQQAEADRQRLVPSVDRTVLAQYERILHNREGLALVPIVGEACGGCHMIQPPQVLNEVAQQTRWVVCENCARLLFDDGA